VTARDDATSGAVAPTYCYCRGNKTEQSQRSEFGTGFERKVPYPVWDKPRVVSMTKTGAIRLVVSIEHRLVTDANSVLYMRVAYASRGN